MTKCPRNLTDCEPLAQMLNQDNPGFICCGHNDGKSRLDVQDRFRLCRKTETDDEISDLDTRTVMDLASVMTGALIADAQKIAKDQERQASNTYIPDWKP